MEGFFWSKFYPLSWWRWILKHIQDQDSTLATRHSFLCSTICLAVSCLYLAWASFNFGHRTPINLWASHSRYTVYLSLRFLHPSKDQSFHATLALRNNIFITLKEKQQQAALWTLNSVVTNKINPLIAKHNWLININ